MKTELLKITQDIEKGLTTEKEARKLLLGLLIVSENTLDKNNLTIVEGAYGYYKLYSNKEFLIEGEFFECNERAFEIIQKRLN